MSRKSTNTSPSLPVLGTEDITTREYYRPSSPNDATSEFTDYPSQPHTPRSNPQLPTSPENSSSPVVQSPHSGDLVEIITVPPPSPSPSDIVVSCDLEDMPQMSELERETRGEEKWVRKKMLLELQGRLREEKEEKWAARGREG